MAGHSQFKNIMHRKGAQDAKRAKAFTKLIRELTVAAQAGDDPTSNPRLRTAIISAKSANMPKDTMERAIKRGSGGDDTAQYAEMRYEGYGPSGVALIVEALTDNRNRTAAEVRATFNKLGGNLGEAGSVSYLFTHEGRIAYSQEIAEDELLESALALGALDMVSFEDTFHIITLREDWLTVREALEKKFGAPLHAAVVWTPQTTVTLNAESQNTVKKLINTLEDNDDVQSVWHNVEDL